jgi:hypothetical protein
MAASKATSVVLQCKYCREEQPMKPFSEGMNGQIIWLRCAGCSRTTFLKKAEYQHLASAMKAPRVVVDGERVNYDPTRNFMVGQQLYHRLWDDCGEVVKKLTTKEGKTTIVVAFSRLGERILIEDNEA